MKDLICLSELPLNPILNHSEQSAVAEVFLIIQEVFAVEIC